MNLKFNWGTAIVLVIIVFFGLMISIIIFSINQKVNLVSPDYYPKGIDYDKQIEKVQNLNKLGSKIEFEKSSDSIYLVFPDYFSNKKISGTVQFYFMTDFEKDQTFKLEIDGSNKQAFYIPVFTRGRYILKIDWGDGNKSYYQEINLNL